MAACPLRTFQDLSQGKQLISYTSNPR
jgi:hypothetical protein